MRHVARHWQLLEVIYSQDIRKNLNHVQKDNNNILSVIIFLGTNVQGGEIVFNRDKMNYIVKIELVLNHSYRSWFIGAFDKNVY